MEWSFVAAQIGPCAPQHGRVAGSRAGGVCDFRRGRPGAGDRTEGGVGVGTLYRHFPQRSDLIVAVFQREIDACADAARALASEHEPGEALARWMRRYMDFIAAKRGLATALHSGNPAFETLPAYFQKRLLPALRTLLEAAAAAGEVRADVEPADLLRAVASLCMSAHDDGPGPARRMVALLVDGLRYGASPSGDMRSGHEQPSRPAPTLSRQSKRAKR